MEDLPVITDCFLIQRIILFGLASFLCQFFHCLIGLFLFQKRYDLRIKQCCDSCRNKQDPNDIYDLSSHAFLLPSILPFIFLLILSYPFLAAASTNMINSPARIARL